MFRIDVLPAEFGDSLWIEYGAAKKPGRILIDCGTKSVYNDALKARIEALKPAERHFELFIVSHVDIDHIGGSIDFIANSRTLGLTFGDIWFNGYKQLMAASNLLGGVAGEDLTALLEDLKLPWNKAFKKNPVVVRPTGKLPRFTTPGGMAVTLLSPFPQHLVDLIPEWKEACKEAHIVPGEGRRPVKRARGPVMLGDPDVDVLAQAKFTSDRAAPNGTSIAVLAEFAGKRAVLAADAFAPTLLSTLSRLSNGSAQKIHAFKVSHHGSRNNTSPQLVQAVKCKNWIVSTNGKQFGHPDQEAIARIIKFGTPGQTLYFNYETQFNDMWQSARLGKKFDFTAAYPKSRANGQTITL
jgi:hypothetical protein